MTPPAARSPYRSALVVALLACVVALVLDVPSLVRLSSDRDDARAPSHARAGARFITPTSCAHAVSLGRRWRQEDAARCAVMTPPPPPSSSSRDDAPSLRFAAVYDGHDGADASELARATLHERVDAKLREATAATATRRRRGGGVELTDEIVERAMREAITELDEAFLATRAPGGTTVVAALMRGRDVWIAHVGDSRAFACSPRRDRGLTSAAAASPPPPSPSRRAPPFAAARLTRDHAPDDPAERARIERAGGGVVVAGGTPRVNGELAVRCVLYTGPHTTALAW
jgi:serine/threonine protein phosphatase PrpC